MSKNEELERLEEKYNGISKELESSEDELRELLNDDVVMRYIEMKDRVEQLEFAKKQAYTSYIKYGQMICPHDIYFFRKQYKKRMMCTPEFLCLNCGKMFKGMLPESKQVINQDYIEEDSKSYFGDYDEYEFLAEEYKRLKEEDRSKEEIIEILTEEISKKHKKRAIPFRLIRK